MAVVGIALYLALLFSYGSGASLEEKECLTHISEVASQADFDMKKFAGAWYTHSRTTYVFKDHAWDSMTNVVYPYSDGSIMSVTSGHPFGKHHLCRTAPIHMSESGTAEYTGFFMGKTLTFKVLYTDYNTSAMFYCFHVNDDGTCNHKMEQIELWSRVPDDMSRDEIYNLVSHVSKIECTDVNDLTIMVQGNCETAMSAEPPRVRGVCQNSPYDMGDLSQRNTLVGDWHTLIVGVGEGKESSATSYNFVPGSDDNVLYVLKSHQRGKTCSETKIEKYQKITGIHYLQMGASIPNEFWVDMQSSGDTVVFFCLERASGRCSKSRVELLSQDNTPVNFVTLQTFTEANEKHICQNYDMYVDQRGGFCKVSALLVNILTMQDKMHHGKTFFPEIIPNSKDKQNCVLKDIPLQESLQMSQLVGIWYEITRPRGVINQYESPVLIFELNDDNTLYITYSVSINHRCTPATSVHIRPLNGSTNAADMESQLDGPYGLFTWNPFKVVYADGMYTLLFECFRKDGDGNCLKTRTMILGRHSNIDDKTKNKLYAMFPSLCTSVEHIQETFHHEDCSDWVMSHKETTGSRQECNAPDIPVQNDVSLEQMTGTWYVIAVKNSETNRIDIRQEGSTYVVDAFAKQNGKCSIVSTESITQSGLHKNGDFLLASQQGMAKIYYSMKIVYTDYQVATVYECLEEDIEGKCTTSGTRVFLFSRTRTIPSFYRSNLESQLKLRCGDLSTLETVTDHCVKEKSCLVSDIPQMENVDMQKLTGIWYDIYVPTFFMNVESGTFKFTQDEHQHHIHIQFTSLTKNGTCRQTPLTSNWRRRYNNDAGVFLTTPLTKKLPWGFFSVKVLYTDYVNILIPYICVDINLNGKCNEKGKRMRIMSRSSTVAPEVKSRLMKYLDTACMTADLMKDAVHNVDCSSVLV